MNNLKILKLNGNEKLENAIPFVLTQSLKTLKAFLRVNSSDSYDLSLVDAFFRFLPSVMNINLVLR